MKNSNGKCLRIVLILWIQSDVYPCMFAESKQKNNTICPTDFKPLNVESPSNCSFSLFNDSNNFEYALRRLKWEDGKVQRIITDIRITKNDTRQESSQSMLPNKWLLSYIDPNGPYDFVSWSSDFKVLSLGLVNEDPDITVKINETSGHCVVVEGGNYMISEIVKLFTGFIREKVELDKQYDYDNIHLCYLSKFKWFEKSGWYWAKRLFGIPFQEFGYKCCMVREDTVCCDDKLHRIEGYRLLPYIISICLLSYSPILLMRLANICNKDDDNTSQREDSKQTQQSSKQVSVLLRFPFFLRFCYYKDIHSNQSNDDNGLHSDQERDAENVPLIQSNDDNGLQSNQERDAENVPLIQSNDDNGLQSNQERDAENVPLIQSNDDNGLQSNQECDAENVPLIQSNDDNGLQSNQERDAENVPLIQSNDDNGLQSIQERDAENASINSINEDIGIEIIQNSQGNREFGVKNIQSNQNVDEIDKKGIRECDDNDDYDYYCFLDCQCCFDIPKCNCNCSPCCDWIFKRLKRLTFVFLLFPSMIYIEFILLITDDDWRELLQTIGKNDLLFGFPTMLGSIKNTMFLPPEGPMGALIIYYILGFCIIVLPKDFENSVLGKGILVFRRRTVNQNSTSNRCMRLDVEQAPTNQSEALEEEISKAYFRIKIILQNFMYLPLNAVYWKRGKMKGCRLILWPLVVFPIIPFSFICLVGWIRYISRKLDVKCNCYNSLKIFVLLILSLVFMIFYGIFVVMLSYSIYLLFYILFFASWGFIISPNNKSKIIIFILGALVFEYQIIRDSVHVYTEFFHLIVEICESDNTLKEKYITDHEKGQCINEKLVVDVFRKIRPAFVQTGHVIIKTVIVIAIYSSAITFMLKFTEKISDVIERLTILITSVTPIILQWRFKTVCPKRKRVELIIRECERNSEKAKLIGTEAERIAKETELTLKEAERSAKEAEQKAKDTEQKLKETEINAKKAAQNAKDNELKLKEAERNAKEVERYAKEVEQNAKESELIAKEAVRNATEAERNANEAELKTKEAEQKTKEAELKTKEAKLKTKEAKLKTKEAELRSKEAELKTKEVNKKTKEAERNAKEAGRNAKKTELTTEEAERHAKEAERNVEEAELKTKEDERNTNEAERNAGTQR